MRKVLAVLLAAVMLLGCGATALAAEETPAALSYTVSDISFIANNQLIELPGVTAVLEAANVDGTRGFRMSVNKDDAPLGELTFTVQPDGLVALHMDSATLGAKDYGIDLAAILSRSMKSGIDKLVGMLQGLDTDGMAQKIIDSLLQEPAAPEASVETEAPEATEAPTPSIDAEGIVDVLSECVTTKTEQMGGEVNGPDGSAVTIPDGEYTTTTVTVDTDAVCRMLDMVSVNGQSLGMGDAVRNADVDISFSVTSTDGEAADLGQFNVTAVGEGNNFTLGLGYSSLDIDEGTQTTWSLGVSNGADVETMSVSGVTLTITSTEGDGSFTPAPVDESALIMLSDMEYQEAVTEASQAFTTLLTDMMAPLAAEETPAE